MECFALLLFFLCDIPEPIFNINLKETNRTTFEHEWKQVVSIVNYLLLLEEEKFLSKKALQSDRVFQRRYKLRFDDSMTDSQLYKYEINSKIAWIDIEINKLKQYDAIFATNFSRLFVIEASTKQDMRIQYAKNNLNASNNLKLLYDKYIERTNLELELINKEFNGISYLFDNRYKNKEDVESISLKKRYLENKIDAYKSVLSLLDKYIPICEKTVDILKENE